MSLPAGAVPSPNVWQHPHTYALLAQAADPDGLVDAELRRRAPWAGGTVVDVGCGPGAHLGGYAVDAARVVGVEPHPGLVRAARSRVAGLPAVRVLPGTAQAMPLPDRSADAVVARWAYFFGPGCEPGIREAFRVLRPGGALAVVDLDAAATTGYARWFRDASPDRGGPAVDAFFARLGFGCTRLAVPWAFRSRGELEAVLRIEFPRRTAERAVRTTTGLELAVPTVVRWRAAVP